MKCAKPAYRKRIRKGFCWRPREFYLLGFYSWLGVLLLLTVARERMVLRIPLCRSHYWRYRFARLFGRSLLLATLPAAVAWAVVTEDLFGLWVVFFSMLVLGMSVLILFGRPLRTLFINPAYGCFIGAADEFLLHFPERRSHNPNSG